MNRRNFMRAAGVGLGACALPAGLATSDDAEYISYRAFDPDYIKQHIRPYVPPSPMSIDNFCSVNPAITLRDIARQIAEACGLEVDEVAFVELERHCDEDVLYRAYPVPCDRPQKRMRISNEQA